MNTTIINRKSVQANVIVRQIEMLYMLLTCFSLFYGVLEKEQGKQWPCMLASTH